MKFSASKLKWTQRGITLTELMVSLVVSLILLSGVVMLYSGSKSSYRTGESLSRVQEKARFAFDLLTHEIRQAGFHGCAAVSEVQNISRRATGIDIGLGIVGFEFNGGGAWVPALPGYLAADAAIGDVVEVIRASDRGMALLQFTPPTQAPILGNNSLGLKMGDLVMVSDCAKTDIFTLSGSTQQDPNAITVLEFNDTTVNYSTRLSKEYDTTATVHKFIATSFFIGLNNQVPTLYRVINGVDKQPLVDGIEDMQVLYGISVAGRRSTTVQQYVRADQINGRMVMSVRIALLVAGLEQVALEKRIYRSPIVDGVKLFAAPDGTEDRKIRREFVATIALRNHTL